MFGNHSPGVPLVSLHLCVLGGGVRRILGAKAAPTDLPSYLLWGSCTNPAENQGPKPRGVQGAFRRFENLPSAASLLKAQQSTELLTLVL